MSGRGGETTAPPPLMPSAARKLIVPARSEFGSAGEKIIITANHFKVDIGNIDLHQYDVTIAPEVTSKNMRRHIMESVNHSYLASPQFGNLLLAYDGNKSAFATGPLPFNSQEFVVQLLCSRGDREFKVTIKFAARKELNDLRQFLAGRQQDNPKETIRALNLVLRDKRLIVGRSLCGPFLGRGPLTDGIEYWNGFYQSLRPTQMGLSLNIDHLAGAFYEPQPLKWFVDRLLGTTVSSLTAKERIKVERAIKGVMVETEYGRRYKVQGLTVLPISQLNFIEKTGTIKTVVGYFSEKYNYELRFPAFPAIQAGTDAKPVYLPMEFCRVTAGQRYSLRLNERQVTRFLRATCQRPTIKFAGIDDVIRQMCPLSNAFEMKVPGLWTPIVARVLPPPSLCYRGPQSEVTPAAGQWTMSGLKVINGGIVDYWTIINFSLQNEEAVLDFVHELVSMCRDKGIVFKPQPLLPMRSAMLHTLEKAIADLHSQASAQLARISPGRHLQMLFVILPETKGSYSRIKRVCETELGIASQCCKPQHIMKRSSEYFANVALKINLKAVASMDWPEVTRYKALVSALQHRQEIILDLYTTRTDPKRGLIHGGMIRELLIAFKKETGHEAHHLIFYRDEVSVDQFNEVLLNEMDMIRKVCISLDENYLPPVTFIVVQKRHHTRLFPVRHGDRASSDRNGIVVDTNICHPSEFDFYLCSHAGIQGTSRPTHYHVLTNSLRYTYARCTRSVSTVPPAYYAHLAEFRARSYIGGDQYESSSCGQRATRDRVADYNEVQKDIPSIKGKEDNQPELVELLGDVSDPASCSDVLVAVNTEAHPSNATEAKSTCSDSNVKDAQKGEESYHGPKMERPGRREDLLTGHPSEESKTFCKGVDHHKLLIDPLGKIHALNTKSNICYWSTPTSKPSCIYLKDENQTLVFTFSKKETDEGHVNEEDVDTMDCPHLFHVADNGERIFVGADSLESLQDEVRRLCGEHTVVSGSFSKFWIHLETGEMLDYTYSSSRYDQKELILVNRKNYEICNHRDEWKLTFSTFQVLDEPMRILHMRNVEQLYSFWQRFKVKPEEYVVYYDTRKRSQGKERFKGSCYLYEYHAFVSVEPVPPDESPRLIDKHFQRIGIHPNILEPHGLFTFNEKHYMAFELVSHDLTEVDDYESPSHSPFKIMSGILEGAKHLYALKRIHGNLDPKNVVFVDGMVKLCGMKREGKSVPEFDMKAKKKEMKDLGDLLEFCFTRGGTVATNFWEDFEENNPIEFHLIKSLQRINEDERLPLPQLPKHPYFLTFDEKLTFLHKVSQFLKESHSPEQKLLERALDTNAIKNRVFLPRKTTIHKALLEQLEIHTIYRTYTTRGMILLLRISRNSSGHEENINREIAKLYGQSREGLEKYFSRIYPNLYMATFEPVQRFCKGVPDFNDYIFGY